MPLPLVTCVCPTANRREWLSVAIACFLSQDYPRKELVIVATEQSDFEGLLIPLGAPVTTWVFGKPGGFLDHRPQSIGSKRNCGAANAKGEIICHWDDDDFSSPTRLSDQVGRLLSTEKAVTGYHSLKFTDGRHWWKYRGVASWAFDTSLCYRKSFWETHRFPDINDGLEYDFREAAIAQQQFISVDAGDQMYATIHPGNTSPHVMTPGNCNWFPLVSEAIPA